ncbi:hypothetical protein G7Y89_g14640 [Cudoniella acicularis]|uniref:Rhodopsin domain-containing protein n=1 Tax=Cudoniella acicularis TaxID=354080 RepID=A0A8H4QYZ6_9HELO|nr:hypothetical protein G7Y89_g14640 [Cudoniella acicularis]
MYLARQTQPPDPAPVDLTSHGKTILGITGFFTVFATTVVILRMYVRAVILKKLGADDYVMIFASLCSVSAFVFFVSEVNLGVGEHIENPHLIANYTEVLHWTYHHGWIIVVGISSVKISIGFFLLRLVQKKWFKRCIVAWIVFLVVFTLACLGTLIFQCIPIEAAWDFSLRFDPDSKCYNLTVFRSIGLFNGAINIFTDFLFASLPIPVILSLKINMRTKLSLICILGLGYFACVSSIIKEVVLSNFFKNNDSFFNNAFNIWNDRLSPRLTTPFRLPPRNSNDYQKQRDPLTTLDATTQTKRIANSQTKEEQSSTPHVPITRATFKQEKRE